MQRPVQFPVLRKENKEGCSETHGKRNWRNVAQYSQLKVKAASSTPKCHHYCSLKRRLEHHVLAIASSVIVSDVHEKY